MRARSYSHSISIEVELKLCCSIYLGELVDFINSFLEKLKLRLRSMKHNVIRFGYNGKESYYMVVDSCNRPITGFTICYDNGSGEDYVYTCLKLTYELDIDNEIRKIIRTTLLSFIDTCREHDKEIETYTTIVKTVKTGGKIYTK